MIQNRIIIIPFNLPWVWTTDYTNQTAKILSKKNIVICFLWEDALSIKQYITFRKKPEFLRHHSKNIFLYSPVHVIPFRRFKLITNLNLLVNVMIVKLLIDIIARKFGRKRKIAWIFHPNFHYFSRLLGRKYVIVYDCIDFFAMGSREEKLEIANNEQNLVQKADLVVANSKVLRKHLLKYRKDAHLVPQGFRLDQYLKYKNNKKAKREKPLIGYIGAVNYRIAYNLLIQLAKRNPKWNFIVSGPILEKEKITKEQSREMGTLFNLPNVRYELRNKKEMPQIISEFDIAMIPYDIFQDFNKYCYPMKLFEYFYLGKPVVTTPIEELKRFPKFVKIGKTAEEWEWNIKNLLSKPWPIRYKRRQRKLARENSWQNKIEKIMSYIRSQPENPASARLTPPVH